MKKIITLMVLLVATSVFAAEEKQVCVDKTGKDGKVLVTADDWGKVKLFKYPCPVEKSSFFRVGISQAISSFKPAQVFDLT